MRTSRLVAEDGQTLPEPRQGFGEHEIAAAVQIGEQATEVGVAVAVARQQHRPLPAVDGFGADDRRQSVAPRRLQEMGDAVEAVAVGQRQAAEAQACRGAESSTERTPHWGEKEEWTWSGT